MQISLQHKCSTDYEYNWILQVLSRLFPLVPAGSTKKSPFSVLREHPIHVVNLHDNFFHITLHNGTVLEVQVVKHIQDVGLVLFLPNLNDTCSLVLKVVNAVAINDENM
ncbi:MAG: hypothetical protein NZO16_07020, partial [Deltaproteobacteria bacterium]|nr:hypothetical protein [Deltaproteobacteria bacterium]